MKWGCRVAALTLTLACHLSSPATQAKQANVAAEASPRQAAYFGTQADGKPVRGPRTATLALERVAVAVQGTRTPALVGDSRLAEVALALARRIDPRSQSLDFLQLARLTRDQGLINELPQVLWVSAETLERAHSLVVERTQPLVTRYASTHFGVAAEKRGPSWLVVVVLERRSIELEPIPVELSTAATVRVRARLLDELSDATLVVTRPDGNVETAAQNRGEPTLDHSLTLSEGLWGLEIIGTGKQGPNVVANMVVQVGAANTAATVNRHEVAPSTVAGFMSSLEALIAEERARQGLPALMCDSALDAVAAAHSLDMRDHHFVGHISPTTGGPDERIVRARVPAWGARENVARGYAPSEVHALLLGSPAHRASILSPSSDRLGLGIVEQREQGRTAFYVTELFATQPFEITPDQALADAAASVLALRSARDLSPLVPDKRFSEAATRAAERFLAEPALSQDALLQAAMAEARRPRGAKSMTARLFTGLLPSSIKPTAELLDPAARWLGVGIARGNHPQLGVDALAMVVFVAK